MSGIDDEALELLMNYDFPGNIRQLENMIEHAFILCSRGQIGVNHLPPYLTAAASRLNPSVCSIEEARKSGEEEAIMKALRKNNYNRLATAKELGMHKTTLFRKLKKLKIKLPDVDGRSSCSPKNGDNST